MHNWKFLVSLSLVLLHLILLHLVHLPLFFHLDLLILLLNAINDGKPWVDLRMEL